MLGTRLGSVLTGSAADGETGFCTSLVLGAGFAAPADVRAGFGAPDVGAGFGAPDVGAGFAAPPDVEAGFGAPVGDELCLEGGASS